MNFIKITNVRAIVLVEDGSGPNDHMELVSTFVKLIDDGIKEFVIDFSGLKKGLSSNMVGILLSIIKKVNGRVSFDHLSEDNKDLLTLVGL